MLASLAEKIVRNTWSERDRDRDKHGDGPLCTCANAAVDGGDAQAGQTTPNAMYTGDQAGLYVCT